MKSIDEKIEREKAKQKAWIAAEHAKKRKERNSRIFAIGAHVVSVIGTQDETVSVEEYKRRVERLIKIGLTVDKILGREANPMFFEFFLHNQEERGLYFSKFMNRKENEKE